MPVDDTSLMRGENYNIDFVSGKLEPQFFNGDILPTITIDSQPIRNLDKILALLQRDGDALTTVKIPTNGTDRYSLTSKAADIVYVSRYISSYIVSASSTSVCVLTAPVAQKIAGYDARFIINNLGGKLVCQITRKSTGVAYIRAFSISGTTITLLDPISGAVSGITGLAGNDKFELLNAFDVLLENLEATTGYPVKGYVKKHIVPTENAYIIFNQYDQPQKLSGEQVCISYKALENYNQVFSYDDSINHYGLYTYTNELNFAVTQAVIDTIDANLKVYSEPQITIELPTFRPTKPKKGWVVSFNITDTIVGRFIVTAVSEDYISPKGQKVGKPLRIWKVTFQNYTNTLDAYLAGLKRRNDLSQALLASNIIQKSFFTFNLNFNFVDNPTQILKPTNLIASGIGSNGFTVTADAVTGASRYIYRLSTHSDFRDAPDGYNFPSPVTSPTVTISAPSILPSTLYYFDMAAIIGGVQTDWASLPSVTTSGTAVDFTGTLDLYYNFDGGNAYDQSGNTNDGTKNGSVTTVAGFMGYTGQQFDANADYISVVSNANFKSSTKMSFLDIVNFDNLNDAGQLLFYKTSTFSGSSYQIWINGTTNKLAVLFYNGANTQYLYYVSNALGLVTGTTYGIGVSLNLVADTLECVLGQTTLTMNIQSGSQTPAGLSDIAVFDEELVIGGWNGSSSTGSGNTRGIHYRFGIGAGTHWLSGTAIKAQFALFGL